MPPLGNLAIRFEYRSTGLDSQSRPQSATTFKDDQAILSTRPILVYCFGNKMLKYEELDSGQVQPTDRSLDGYKRLTLYDGNPKSAVAVWDLPNSASQNKANIESGVLSLAFAQRCFLSTSGRVSWALLLTSSKSITYVNQFQISISKSISAANGRSRRISEVVNGLIHPIDSDTQSPEVNLFGRQFNKCPHVGPLVNCDPNDLRVTFGPNSPPRYELTIKDKDDKDRDFGGGLLRLSQRQFLAWQELAQVDSTADSETNRKSRVWVVGLDDLNSRSVIKEVWNRQVANPYAASLEAVLGGSRTSFVPYWDEAGIPNVDWVAKFHLDDGSDALKALAAGDFYATDAAAPKPKANSLISSQLISVLP